MKVFAIQPQNYKGLGLRYETEAEAREVQEHFGLKDCAIIEAECSDEYRCEVCGGLNVEGTAWIDLNMHEICDSEPPDDDCWCPDCEEHVRTAYGIPTDEQLEEWANVRRERRQGE